MISQERFEDKLKWLSEVTGSAIRKTTSEALWEELRDVDGGDFDRAIKDLGYSDEKVNLNNLWKHISRHRTERIERETQERSQQEEEETIRWFKQHKGSRDQCIANFQCGICQRVFCDIVSKDCSEAIKRVISEDISGDDMHRLLAKKFHGIGFESNVPELEPF